MNIFSLSWKNLKSKPLSMTLSIVLFALGVGLISILFLLEKQLQDNFEKNLAGVDLVIGAKGSPLQMILSSMYHIDAPTGNISLEEARPFLNPKHRIIKDAMPLSMGDSYNGYRIVGTNTTILDWYEASIDKGKIWEHHFEVTVGAAVAQALELKLGDTFNSSHGLVKDENLEHKDANSFKVVGILKPSGTVLDQLILTTTQSLWMVHDHGEEEETTTDSTETADHHDHDHGDHHDHDHEHNHEHDAPKSLLEEPADKEITSILVRFKGHNFQALNMQRSINQNTDMQAATPAIEINRLFNLMDSGERALRMLAIVIIFVSGLSIFISLFSSLRERKYELALMRAMGASPTKIFTLIIFEGLLLAIIGYVLGLILSHFGMQILAASMEEQYRYSFSGWIFLTKELWLLVGALVIGFVAAILPAIQASRTDIADTLVGK